MTYIDLTQGKPKMELSTVAMTQNEVEKLAELARLRFREKELRTMVSQLENIFDFMRGLPDMKGEMSPERTLQTLDHLRRDQIRSSLPRDAALQNAPSSRNGFFCVKRVLEKEGEGW